MKKISSACLVGLLLSSCTQKMGVSGHLKVFAPSPIFEENALVRSEPDHTVAEETVAKTAFAPEKTDLHGIQQGQKNFRIYCSVCHGESGYGNGSVVKRGFIAPPSFHVDRLREAKDDYFFQVISQGYGIMYGYADRLNVEERRQVISYVRALQLSQNFPVSQLSPTERAQLETKR